MGPHSRFVAQRKLLRNIAISVAVAVASVTLFLCTCSPGSCRSESPSRRRLPKLEWVESPYKRAIRNLLYSLNRSQFLVLPEKYKGAFVTSEKRFYNHNFVETDDGLI